MGLLSKLVRPLFAAFAAFALTSSGMAAAQCTGSPPMYNGLPCATTTRYWDGQLGACGCGSNNSPYSWQWESYTAAGSQAIFDSAESSWCGSGCGSCYELTPTGQCPTGSPCATETSPIVVMVTNLCPYNGNQEWCPDHNSTNSFGYGAHFDLMDYNMAGLISDLGWNNPVVTYKRVSCGSGTLGSPTCAEAATCECSAEAGCESGGSASSGTSPTVHATAAPTVHATVAPTTHANPTTHATAAPTTHANPTTHATAAPTTHANPTTHATAAPTKHASAESSSTTSCRAGISFALTSSWSGGGVVSITVSNTGSSAITAITLSVPGSATPWNLVSSSSSFTLPAWALPLAAGSSFSSAGYTFEGDQPAAGSVLSVSC